MTKPKLLIAILIALLNGVAQGQNVLPAFPSWMGDPVDYAITRTHPLLGPVRTDWIPYFAHNNAQMLALNSGYKVHFHNFYGDFAVEHDAVSGTVNVGSFASGFDAVAAAIPYNWIDASGTTFEGIIYTGCTVQGASGVSLVTWSVTSGVPQAVISSIIAPTTGKRFSSIGVVSGKLYCFDAVSGILSRVVDSDNDGRFDLLDPTTSAIDIDSPGCPLSRPPVNIFRNPNGYPCISSTASRRGSYFRILDGSGSLVIEEWVAAKESDIRLMFGGMLGQGQSRIRVYGTPGTNIQLFKCVGGAEVAISAAHPISVPGQDWCDVNLTKSIKVGDEVIAREKVNPLFRSLQVTVGDVGPRFFEGRPLLFGEEDSVTVHGDGFSSKHSEIELAWIVSGISVAEFDAIVTPEGVALTIPQIPGTLSEDYMLMSLVVKDSRYPGRKIVRKIGVVRRP